MQLTARQLCQIVQGELEGNPDVIVERPSKIEEAQKGSLSFLANPKYEIYIYDTDASVVLVHKAFIPSNPVKATLIRVENVYASLGMLLSQYEQGEKPHGISSLASIHPEATVSEDVYIGPFAMISKGVKVGSGSRIYPHTFIGDHCEIGENVILYPGVIIYHHCLIADRCTIHANTVIGSDGFGYSKGENGHYTKIAQVGNVVIEEDVEIGANTVVDRATMGSTLIRKGVKLDNLIQVAHNVEIGQNTVVAAQAGIAGSTKIGRNVLVGGQAGFVGHIEVADHVQVQAQSGVAGSISERGEKVYGSPALPYRNYLQSYTIFRELPALLRRIEALEHEINVLKETQPH
ncbi:MAG TPA: UDP-3-O-(3-hydroxymyristoyl)glucosamine N-acyltransferase [Saprospiraceae bacterium]|nr:UDP-3-O-(3-hydroxymyristoyl)glucosamine N-acyltransferase [Saprospiraceae bacterium]